MARKSRETRAKFPKVSWQFGSRGSPVPLVRVKQEPSRKKEPQLPYLGIYSWSQFTIPAGIPNGNLTGDSHANDPAAPIYDPGNPVTWIGETFTFNGGAPTQIEITDDDGLFEDAYVETGAAQTLTTGITIDGTFYPAGSSVQNEFSMIDAGGNQVWVVAINGVNVGFTYRTGEEPTPGQTFTAQTGLDGDPLDNADGTSASTISYNSIICYAADTTIDTPDGPRRAANLTAGAKVCTLDDGEQPILWAGRTHLQFSGRDDRRRPVCIPAGSLGGGLPRRDLAVSPQHRMLINAGPERAVFAAAKGLLPLRRLRILRGITDITYVHLLLPRHSVIFAEGAPSESFYPGPSALEMMVPEQRREVLAVLADLNSGTVRDYGAIARPCLTVAEARAWSRAARSRTDALAAGMVPSLRKTKLRVIEGGRVDPKSSQFSYAAVRSNLVHRA